MPRVTASAAKLQGGTSERAGPSSSPKALLRTQAGTTDSPALPGSTARALQRLTERRLTLSVGFRRLVVGTPSRDMGPTAPAPLHRSPPRRGHNRSLAAAPNLSIRTGPVLPARPYVRVADRRRTDLVKISNVRSRTYGRVRGQKRDRGRRWRLLSGRRRAPRLPPLRGLAGDHRRCSQRPRRSR